MNNSKLFLLLGITLLSSCGGESGGGVSEEFSATVSVSANTSSVNEGAGTASFSITLSETNTSGGNLTIPYTLSGTASAGSDFTSSESSVIIESNESSATVNLTITDDAEVEDDETVTLTLGTLPSSLSSGTNSSGTITISDNDDNEPVLEMELSFGAASGSTITISDWTDVGADSYLVIISPENSFADITNESSTLASTTYLGYGEQVIYNGSNISSVTVSLLQYSADYYFKVVPVTSGTYDNSFDASSSSTDICVTTSTTEGQVCFQISSDLRTISSNQLSNHAVGNFPNADPTSTETTREIDLSPAYVNEPTYVYVETGSPSPSNTFWQFGIATNGVEFHPMGLQPWTVPNGNANAGEENWEWQAKVTEEGETDLDAYGAHVTSNGLYHYHGDITGLANEDGSRHSLIYGFAGDGFPIYYKYGYVDPEDPSSGIKELLSSYQVKSGSRTGTGTAGVDYPGGTYDGTYIQDYEYVENLGDLDECNGRTGITPEFPEGTYYYVITKDFPVTPNCFHGTPDDDWQIGNKN